LNQPTGPSKKGSNLTRDWTQGSILNNLLGLTWPIVVSQSLLMIGPFIDMVWIGRLGPASVAGAGVATLVIFVANSTIMGLTTGMRALIGRFFGAGDKKMAVHASMQSFVIGAIYSVIIAMIGIFFSEKILMLFGVEPEVVREGAIYLRIEFIGIMTLTLDTFNNGIMQSSGDSVTPMRITFFFRIIHLVLCPFLIFGWWIFPAWGVSGAAASTVISQAIGGIIGIWILFSGRSRLRLNINNWRLDAAIMWRIVRIGIPNCLMHIQHHLSLLALVWFISPFGTTALAAHTLWTRIDAIPATIALAVGMGSGVLGAQNLGAGKPERAGKSGWAAAGFTAIFMLLCMIVIYLWAEAISGIFTDESNLIALTGEFLRIAAVSFIPLGVSMTIRQFLNGVGDTVPALLFELIPAWLILMPLAYLLPEYTEMGVNGVRWALAIRWLVGGSCYVIYFLVGKWLRRKV
jgi:putative MATE family efflux protein